MRVSLAIFVVGMATVTVGEGFCGGDGDGQWVRGFVGAMVMVTLGEGFGVGGGDGDSG